MQERNSVANANKFTPKPGDKIICNNGKEFICCTLETLISKGFDICFKNKSDSVIFGTKEEYLSWMYWHNECYPNDPEWNIREVIPQSSEVIDDKKEEVKEEPRYTVDEVFYAIKEHCGKYDSPIGCEFEIKNLLKRFDEDPEYKEYLRLKAIYE